MVDEKYVPLQDKSKSKVMIKSAVIFEGINSANKRNHLVNKTIYSSVDKNFWEDIYDIVCSKYDIDQIKKVHIMGDGAQWIRSGVSQFNQSSFYLDKFHFKQSINRISVNKNIKNLLVNAILHRQKDQFDSIVETLIDTTTDSSRINTITANHSYILACSMEVAISHNLASIFTCSPKTYSKKNLRHYLSFRNLRLNNIDIRNYYLDTLTVERTDSVYFELAKRFISKN